jgi:hypothetical protein
MEELLTRFLGDLKSLRRDIRNHRGARIARTQLRQLAEDLGKRWFSEIQPELLRHGILDGTAQSYSEAFTRLIKLSAPNNLKKSYTSTLTKVTSRFRDEIILPIQASPTMSSTTPLDDVIARLPNSDENVYLQEAVDCAKAAFLRAAVVLGWCAAIDRIHRKIESVGFVQFNVTSVKMAAQSKGRYKRFNQALKVSSLGELREIFDTVVLWVIEGMGLVDANQHTRLRSCFDLRCQCAHPGEAPITEYNLMSFFSDLDHIIFSSKEFEL